MLSTPFSCKQDAETPPPPAPRRSGAWFTETSRAVGLTFRLLSGERGDFLFPEIIPGGLCAFDYDGDGWVDLYVVQSGSLDRKSDVGARNAMFHNRGDGTFENVTDDSRTGDTGYGMGCTYGDYDNDGDPDLYVTNFGANVLYRNEGNGKFTDVGAEAGVRNSMWGTSTAFADYNGDGLLDLFVVNYVAWSADQEIDCRSSSNVRTYCSPNNYNAPTADVLYRNDGDGTFTDVSAATGLDREKGNGLGVACGDFDRDGRVDFYVANDGMPNRLWLGRGNRFEEEALLAGCALNLNGLAEGSMGAFALDTEPDGDLDLFMTHIRMETNTFYTNHGGWFEDVTAAMGLAAPSIGFTGYSPAFSDFDNDADLDLYIANGGMAAGEDRFRDDDPYAQPNQLFENDGRGRFKEVEPRGGTTQVLIEASRGAAVADFDNDGDMDVAVVNKDGPLHFMRNDVGAGRHWIMFRVLNRHGADAIGAELTAVARQIHQHRILYPSYGFCSAGEPRVHFGLGDADSVDKLTVLWPDGRKQALGPFAAGMVHVIRQ